MLCTMIDTMLTHLQYVGYVLHYEKGTSNVYDPYIAEILHEL